MAKLVLEVELKDEISENSLIVYNTKKQKWIVVPRALFLSKIRQDFKDLENKFLETQDKCDKLENDVKTMAKIIKEGLK